MKEYSGAVVPRYLPCDHCCCERCIDLMIAHAASKQQAAKCSECDREIGARAVADMPKNFCII